MSNVINEQLLRSLAEKAGTSLEIFIEWCEIMGFINADGEITEKGIDSCFFSQPTENNQVIATSDNYTSYKVLVKGGFVVIHSTPDGMKMIDLDSLSRLLGFENREGLEQDEVFIEKLAAISKCRKKNALDLDVINGFVGNYLNIRDWELTFGDFNLQEWRNAQ